MKISYQFHKAIANLKMSKLVNEQMEEYFIWQTTYSPQLITHNL